MFMECKTTCQNEMGGEDIQSTYSYECLNAKSTNHVIGIDNKKREVILVINMIHKIVTKMMTQLVNPSSLLIKIMTILLLVRL